MREQLFTELLVEGVWEELGEAGQHFDDVEVHAAVVLQHEQQRTHGRVNHIHVYLETLDELKQHEDTMLEGTVEEQEETELE